jgi:hypothetical protein
MKTRPSLTSMRTRVSSGETETARKRAPEEIEELRRVHAERYQGVYTGPGAIAHEDGVP